MKIVEEIIQQRIHEFTEKCRSARVSLTHQRLNVFRSLASTDTHPTAEEIYQEVHEELPTMSLATVYKTLETFERQGFITKTHGVEGKARYDANTEPHHHMICTDCGAIEDVHDENLNHLSLKRSSQKGFEVQSYQIHFHGVCQKCQQE